MSVLIDTNVILEAITGRAPFNENAEKLFLLTAEDKINASITANSVTDIYYLTRKYLHSIEEARIVLWKLFTLFQILDVTGTDCEKALELNMSDYEDALIATCANRNKVDWIISRNTKDFINSPVPAITPEDFLTKFF